jgi:hypothetical protein
VPRSRLVLRSRHFKCRPVPRVPCSDYFVWLRVTKAADCLVYCVVRCVIVVLIVVAVVISSTLRHNLILPSLPAQA